MTASNQPSVRVVKVGGSLFRSPDLPSRLRNWLDEQPRGNLLLAGGGEWADSVRAADDRFHLGEEQSHWLAASTLRTTARLLHALLPEATLETCWPLSDEQRSRRRETISQRRATIQDPFEFLVADAAGACGPPLPQCWSATSDSIAARLAHAVGASELVLLKSCDVPPDLSPRELSDRRVTDGHFPTAVKALPFRCVNLGCGAERSA